MRVAGKDGSSGRGKQKTQTSGRIKLDWQMAGFLKILLVSNSRLFVDESKHSSYITLDDVCIYIK